MYKKWKVLIHSMTFNRDFGMSLILSRLLERLGCECLIVNNANVTSIPVKLWNPDAVFYVTPGKTENLIKYYPRAKIFLFSAEGSIGYKIAEARIAGNPDLINKLSRIYLWGKTPKLYLLNKYTETEGAKKNIFESKFKIVGNMRGDIVKYRKAINKTSKIKIGFIGNFWLVNSIKKNFCLLRHFFEKRKDGCTWDEGVMQIKYLKVLSEIFDRLEKDKYEISLRPYPLERKDVYQNLDLVKNMELSINDSIDFSSWVAEQDIIIGNGVSTTIALMIITKTPFINLTLLCGGNFDTPDEMIPSELVAAIAKNAPSSFEELFNTIDNYNKQEFYDDDSERLLQGLYSFKDSGSSIFKVAVDIVNSLNEGNLGVPLKSRLPFKIIRIMDYLNLKYRKFRNRDSIENDYSFFILRELLSKVEKEFNHVIESIINDPVNQKLLSSK